MDVYPRGPDRDMYYSGRKKKHTINVQFVCGPDGLFYDVVAKYPGSHHDSTIFKKSAICRYLKNANIPQYHLLADGGYTCANFVLTPLRLPPNGAVGLSVGERRYQASQRKTRAFIERVFGRYKKKFGVLRDNNLRLLMKSNQTVIIACTVLWNFLLDEEEMLPADNLLEVHEEVHQDDEVQVIEGQGYEVNCAKRTNLIQHYFEHANLAAV